MRALYYPHSLNSKIKVEGETAHHFIKVIRLELGEEILLLDGEGSTTKATVDEISKKDLWLKLETPAMKKRLMELDLALGVVKKEALEEILKASVEMGIRNLYLVRTQFSQALTPWTERLQKLLVSSLEQSNNPYLPKIILTQELKEIPFRDYQRVVTFSTLKGEQADLKGELKSTLMMIGPEGGFSEEEEAFLSKQGSAFLELPLPIMRAKTAAILATGYLLGKCLK